MKNSIAIAVAKVRRKIYFAHGSIDSADLEVEVSRVWVSALLLAGTLFALGALVCLATGMIKSGGFLALLRGWLAALGG